MSKTSTEMTLFMGPQHPSMHGLWGLRLTIDGETVISCDAQIGYLHRAFEKLYENRTYVQQIPISDRLCYVAGLSWTCAHVHAVEEIFEIEPPARAQLLRVLFLELQRIASHCLWLAALSTDLGALTMLLYPMNAREMIIDLMESVTGGRLTYNYPRIGGVSRDLHPTFIEDTYTFIDKFEDYLNEFMEMLDENQIFRMRMENIGILSKEDALNLGVVGPLLRGSGVSYDVRKANPYWGYETYDFKVPIGKTGDSYDRYMVRMKEMEESIKIVKQALERYESTEPLIIAEKIPRRPKTKDVLSLLENPRGEAGFHIFSDGKRNPYRVRIKSASFSNVRALPFLLQNVKIADIPAIMGTIDLCVGDLDH